MSRKLVFIILVILACGSVATLVSGLYKQNLTYGEGASITGYGFPSSWYRKTVIVYPGNPTLYSFSWESFALDIAFWSLIIAVPVVVAFRWLKARK